MELRKGLHEYMNCMLYFSSIDSFCALLGGYSGLVVSITPPGLSF